MPCGQIRWFSKYKINFSSYGYTRFIFHQFTGLHRNPLHYCTKPRPYLRGGEMCVPLSLLAASFLLTFSCDMALFLRSSSGFLAGDFKSVFSDDFFASLFFASGGGAFTGFSVLFEEGFFSPFDPVVVEAASLTTTIFPSALALSSSGRGCDFGLKRNTVALH